MGSLLGGQINRTDRQQSDSGRWVNVSPFEALGDCSPLPTPSPVGTALVSPQVVHGAALDVDEEGTEGAAATGISMERTFLRTIVRVNRPFLIAVVLKDTQSIIFLGKVTNPSQA